MFSYSLVLPATSANSIAHCILCLGIMSYCITISGTTIKTILMPQFRNLSPCLLFQAATIAVHLYIIPGS
jgi:hypothetical protein